MHKKIIVSGWGQITQGKELTEAIQDPLGLMAQAARQAEEKSGSAVLENIDGIMTVMTISRHYPDAARQLAQKIKATPRFTHTSKIGGESPQSLINKAAGMIARGELETILIAGAETYYPRTKNPIKPENALFQGLPEDYQGDDSIGATELELRHGIAQPVQGFPLFETALWAESGLEFNAYLMRLGKLWSQHSQIAANHPNAWSKKGYTAAEIITKNPFNRMVAFPYPKLMNPFVTVDLGAAIILMSEEKSRQFRQNRKFSQKENRPVYFIGGGHAKDRQRFLIEKSSFTSSPPLKAAVDKALQRATLTLDEIEAFDLYSCFPCAVGMALKMLELKQNDPRPFTVTGGLGFFGGPGNNYSLHAVATMVEMIAEGRINNGLVTALGWFMHKHAAGIYSATPAETDLSQHDLEDAKAPLTGSQPVPIAEKVTGKGRIETYTVIYKKDGTPDYSVIYGTTEKGLRFIANTDTDLETIIALTTKNQVGKSVQLRYDDQKRRNLAQLL
ncbi:MAG TPA: hypothetical protein EYP64_09090 [Desulfarculaceae bacterium]|nr:hypothetical protein [Desulfarculaceae bacterium]